jgi:hypothetical protein
MSADRNSLLGSPLVLTGMLALVLAGAWRTREWFRDTHPDQVLRSESAEWHEAYDRWVDLGSDAWPGVLDALQGDSGPARRMALLAVASLRDAPSEVRDEVRQLLSAPDPADRREALVAWTGADRDPLHALDELATACGDENSIVRGTALELMLCIGADSIPRLEPLAADRRHPAQAACLQALLSLEASSPSVVELARSLWQDEQLDSDVRRYALALLVCASQATLEELEQGVATRQPPIQSIALWGIREMGPPARGLAETLLALNLPLKLSIPREQTMDGQIVRFPAQAYVSMPLTLDQIDPAQSVPQIAFDEDAGEEQMTDFTLFSVLASIASPGELDLTSLEERLSTLPALDQLRGAEHLRQLGWSEERFGDSLETLFLEGGTALRNPVALRLRTAAPQRAERLAARLRQQLAEDPSEKERRVLLDQIAKLTTSSETASGSSGETTSPAASAPDPEFISHLLELAEGPDDALATSALQTLAWSGCVRQFAAAGEPRDRPTLGGFAGQPQWPAIHRSRQRSAHGAPAQRIEPASSPVRSADRRWCSPASNRAGDGGGDQPASTPAHRGGECIAAPNRGTLPDAGPGVRSRGGRQPDPAGSIGPGPRSLRLGG